MTDDQSTDRTRRDSVLYAIADYMAVATDLLGGDEEDQRIRGLLDAATIVTVPHSVMKAASSWRVGIVDRLWETVWGQRHPTVAPPNIKYPDRREIKLPDGISEEEMDETVGAFKKELVAAPTPLPPLFSPLWVALGYNTTGSRYILGFLITDDEAWAFDAELHADGMIGETNYATVRDRNGWVNSGSWLVAALMALISPGCQIQKMDRGGFAYRGILKKVQRAFRVKPKLPPLYCFQADEAETVKQLDRVKEGKMANGFPRIAVVGGDDRLLRQKWPDDLDVRPFTWGEARRVVEAAQNGKLDKIIILTRWISHSEFETLKRQQATQIILWAHGIPRLAAEIRQVAGLDASPLPQAGATVPEEEEQEQGPIDLDYVTWTKPIREVMTEEGWSLQDIVELLGASDYTDNIQRTIDKMVETGLVIRLDDKYALPKAVIELPPAPEPLPAPEPEPLPTVPALPEPKLEDAPMIPPMTVPAPKPEDYIVMFNNEIRHFTNLQEALDFVSEKGAAAALYKRMKLRVRVELDE